MLKEISIFVSFRKCEINFLSISVCNHLCNLGTYISQTSNVSEVNSDVAKLTERSLPLPDISGSNPVISNFYGTFIFCFQKRRKITRKSPEFVLQKLRLYHLIHTTKCSVCNNV